MSFKPGEGFSSAKTDIQAPPEKKPFDQGSEKNRNGLKTALLTGAIAAGAVVALVVGGNRSNTDYRDSDGSTTEHVEHANANRALDLSNPSATITVQMGTPESPVTATQTRIEAVDGK